MKIHIKTVEGITVAALSGEIDATTAPTLTDKFLPLAEAGGKLLLDMSQVAYMSSAGLRVLLSLYRRAAAHDGKVVLVGLSEEIKDTMTVTGVLGFFTTGETVAEGLAAFK
jgi:anti-sigma B factor antagonist